MNDVFFWRRQKKLTGNLIDACRHLSPGERSSSLEVIFAIGIGLTGGSAIRLVSSNYQVEERRIACFTGEILKKSKLS